MGAIERLSLSAHKKQRLSAPGSAPTTAGSTGTSPPQDRQVAAAIVSQRRADEENDCATEKYSGLRIKCVFLQNQLL